MALLILVELILGQLAILGLELVNLVRIGLPDEVPVQELAVPALNQASLMASMRMAMQSCTA